MGHDPEQPGQCLQQPHPGRPGDNIEQAIDHYEQALKVYTQKDFPADWAMTQNNLANAYNNRIRGDRAENIEQAIEHYELALKVRTKKDFPADWATTQNNLATPTATASGATGRITSSRRSSTTSRP